jgi:hypothetical protein
MTIDTSGQWWTGTTPEDLREYLRVLSGDSYPVGEFRLSQCTCGGKVFHLHVEQGEGVARRTCVECGHKHWIADSSENYEKGMRLKKFRCITCKSHSSNVAVGFSLLADKSEIKWVFVGNRCAECGTLGSMVDWSIGYAPSLQLLSEA